MYHNVPYLLIARICSVFLFVLCVILKVLGTIKLSLFNFGYSLLARKREKRAAAHLWYSVGILGAIIVFVFYFFGVISFFLHVFSTVNPPKCTSVNASVAIQLPSLRNIYQAKELAHSPGAVLGIHWELCFSRTRRFILTPTFSDKYYIFKAISQFYMVEVLSFSHFPSLFTSNSALKYYFHAFQWKIHTQCQKKTFFLRAVC